MRFLLNGEASPWLALPLVTLGFFAIRFFGQGVLSMVARAMIGKWFNRQRGLASAISGTPVSIVFATAPLILYELISLVGGWREAWATMGATLLSAGAFFTWLTFRDNPEECGLLMDGRPAPTDDEEAGLSPEFKIHRELTAPEALRTWAFWVFALSICINGFIGTAIAFHASALAGEAAMSERDFFWLFSKPVYMSIATSFLVGWMTARFRLKYSYLIMVAGQAVGCTSFFFLPSALGQGLYLVGLGCSWGAFGTLTTVTWPRCFGRRHLGQISGWVMLLMVVTSALGPLFFSVLRELSGRFDLAFACSIGLCVVFLGLCWRTENPQRKLAPASP